MVLLPQGAALLEHTAAGLGLRALLGAAGLYGPPRRRTDVGGVRAPRVDARRLPRLLRHIVQDLPHLRRGDEVLVVPRPDARDIRGGMRHRARVPRAAAAIGRRMAARLLDGRRDPLRPLHGGLHVDHSGMGQDPLRGVAPPPQPRAGVHTRRQDRRRCAGEEHELVGGLALQGRRFRDGRRRPGGTIPHGGAGAPLRP